MREREPLAKLTFVGLLAFSASVMTVDGFDLLAMPLIASHVSRQFGISPASLGVVLSSALLGLGVGALFLGPVGDRIGRRPLIIAALACLSLVTLGTGTASTVPQFIFWRFLTGMFLGTCLTNVTALVSEISPPLRRATILTSVSSGVPVGALSAGLLVPIMAVDQRWEAVFEWAGVATAVLAAWGFAVLPKVKSVREAAGGTTIAACLSIHPSDKPRWFQLPPEIRSLFDGQYRERTVLFVFLYSINSCTIYMVTSWLPTLMVNQGFSFAKASQFSSIQSVGSLSCALGIAWLIDRREPGVVLFVTYLVLALGYAAFSVVPASEMAWEILILLAAGGTAGVHLALLAAGAGMYPSNILSTAIGLAVSMGRIGAISGPILGGFLIARQASVPQFFFAGVFPIALCCLGSLLLARLSLHRAK